MSKLPTYRRIFHFLLLALPMLVSSTVQSQATAENRYVQAPITLVQLEPPRQETLPVAENARCAEYSRRTVADYAEMREHRECLIPDSPRWQPNYQSHYQWCLTARPEWMASEMQARDAHLVRCGVRKGMSGRVPESTGRVPEGIPPKVEVRETPTEVRIELPGDVLFDFDKADIRPEAEPTLRQVAEIIQRYPRANVAIAGYTDAKGADTYNLQLSKQRAISVKAWLVQQGGVEGKRMTTNGWGEAKPVAPNTHPDGRDNPEGRQQNRRVELTVKK